MNDYTDATDLDLVPDLQRLAPKEFAAWQNLQAIVGRQDGTIPVKYRELLASPSR